MLIVNDMQYYLKQMNKIIMISNKNVNFSNKVLDNRSYAVIGNRMVKM